MSERERHSPGREQTGNEGLHRARCRVCRHPQREEIEREFLDWESPRSIAAKWKIASYRAIYRHAHAVGLFEKRRGRLLFAVEQIIEYVGEIPPTPSVILGAIRLAYQMEQKERERSPGGSGRGRGYTPVEITVDDYPYFKDCFERRPAEASKVQAGHPAGPKAPAQTASPPGRLPPAPP